MTTTLTGPLGARSRLTVALSVAAPINSDSIGRKSAHRADVLNLCCTIWSALKAQTVSTLENYPQPPEKH